MPAPSKLTEKTLAELEARYRDGATTLEAIDGLMSESTYFKHLKENEEFSERMKLARDYITEIARGVVARRIKKGDPDVSKWWLERKKKDEFSTRSEVTGKDGEALLPKPILGGATSEGGDET